jgi:tRNA(fMet)-specific endonuclease VapC
VNRSRALCQTAAITVAELWRGVERATGAHRDIRKKYLSAVLESVPIIPYTEQTAYKHARIWAKLEAPGKMIGYYDLIVGATALERGGHVAMFNKRHFSQIRGLSIIASSVQSSVIFGSAARVSAV